jgi:hypothetical protein
MQAPMGPVRRVRAHPRGTLRLSTCSQDRRSSIADLTHSPLSVVRYVAPLRQPDGPTTFPASRIRGLKNELILARKKAGPTTISRPNQLGGSQGRVFLLI